jgi:hypothetical protein
VAMRMGMINRRESRRWRCEASHPFDAVDSAFGWLVGVPALGPGSGDVVDTGFASEGHHDVVVVNECGVDGLRCLPAGVDSNFGERVSGESVDVAPWPSPCGV